MGQKGALSRLQQAGLVGAILVVAFVSWLCSLQQITLLWAVVMVALTLVIMIAGQVTNGRFWLGFLIDENNRVSLSRLQLYLWTVIIISALFAAVVANIKCTAKPHGTGCGDAKFQDALEITIPPSLWLLMGISLASPLIANAISNLMKGEFTNDDALNANLNQRRISTTKPRTYATGNVDRNPEVSGASLLDLIRGTQVGDAATVDMTRVQNLFLTLILVGSFCATVGAMLTKVEALPIAKLPEFGENAVILLGISHAGYLAGKAIHKQGPGTPGPKPTP